MIERLTNICWRATWICLLLACLCGLGGLLTHCTSSDPQQARTYDRASGYAEARDYCTLTGTVPRSPCPDPRPRARCPKP
jgi:hypothetical protein